MREKERLSMFKQFMNSCHHVLKTRLVILLLDLSRHLGKLHQSIMRPLFFEGKHQKIFMK